MAKKMKMFSVSEVADILSLSDETIRRMIDRNEIPAYRFGRQFRIKENDFDDFIANSSMPKKDAE